MADLFFMFCFAVLAEAFLWFIVPAVLNRLLVRD